MGTTHAVGWVFDAIGLASPQHRPIVIAHRGDTRHAPENSLASIRAAKQNGADFAEIDVRLTKDGIPVVFHDRRTGRLDAGGRNVLVNSMPLSALQRMIMQQRGMRYSVPTLRQALGDASMSRPGQRRFGFAAGHQDGRAVCPESGRCRGACGRGFQIRRQSDGDVGQPVCGDGLQEHASAVACRPGASGRPDLTQWGDDGTSEARFMDGAARVETVRREVTAKRGGKQRKHPMFRGMRGEAMDFVVFRARDVTSRLLRNRAAAQNSRICRLGGFIRCRERLAAPRRQRDCSARTSRRCSRLVRHITGFPNRSRRRTMTIAPRRDAGRSRVGA